MKFFSSIFKTFILFALVALIFNINIQPVYNSRMIGLTLSTSLYVIASTIVSLIIALGPALIGALLGIILSGEKEYGIAGGCLGLLIAFPIALAIETVLLRYGYSIVSFFPKFTWAQAVLITVVGLLLDILWNIPTKQE